MIRVTTEILAVVISFCVPRRRGSPENDRLPDAPAGPATAARGAVDGVCKVVLKCTIRKSGVRQDFRTAVVHAGRLRTSFDARSGAGAAARCSAGRRLRAHLRGNRVRRPAREGDTLVVWRLDRLARSLLQLIDTIEDLDARGIGFRSLTETIDTTTAGGRMNFHVFGALAEFERNLISDRTRAGLEAARARGHAAGRPPALDEGGIAAARALLRDPSIPAAEVVTRLGVSKTTLYKYVPGGRSGSIEGRAGKAPHPPQDACGATGVSPV